VTLYLFPGVTYVPRCFRDGLVFLGILSSFFTLGVAS